MWIPEVIAGIGLAISILTFIFMLRGQKRAVKMDYVTELEHKLEDFEMQLKECFSKTRHLEEKNHDLMKEKIELLQRLAALARYNGDRR